MTDSLNALVSKLKSATSPLRNTLRDLHAKYKTDDSGVVATYIPELAKADPNWFGIAAVTSDGRIFECGDTQQMFTIQSVSKPFMYGLALESHGLEAVLHKVGVEPTGEAFNSIVLDEKSNRPFNPMVNAGAIAIADLVDGKDLTERTNKMLDMFRRFCGREVQVDVSVFMSERATGHRNRAMGHLMLNFGMLTDRVEHTLELYFQQCSVLVNCRDLAVMGAMLANRGVNPLTGERAIEEKYVKYLLAVMYACGMYDYAGEWAYKVGLPAKSGVGGGIVAAVLGQLGLGTFSPRLDLKGNSVRGVKACQEFSQRYGLHVFDGRVHSELLAKEIDPTRSERGVEGRAATAS